MNECVSVTVLHFLTTLLLVWTLCNLCKSIHILLQDPFYHRSQQLHQQKQPLYDANNQQTHKMPHTLAKGAKALGTWYEMVNLTAHRSSPFRKNRIWPWFWISTAPNDPLVDPGTDLQWIFWYCSGVMFRASQLNSHCLLNWYVDNVHLDICLSSSWISTLVIHGIQVGIFSLSSHMLHATSRGVSTSTWALFSSHWARVRVAVRCNITRVLLPNRYDPVVEWLWGCRWDPTEGGAWNPKLVVIVSTDASIMIKNLPCAWQYLQKSSSLRMTRQPWISLGFDADKHLCDTQVLIYILTKQQN